MSVLSLKTRLIFLILFSWAALSFNTGVASGETPAVREQNQTLVQAGIQLLTHQEYEKALEMSIGMLQENPRDYDAYQIMSRAQSGKKDFIGVIKTVVNAEQYGIRDADLYQRQAEAFFMIGAHEPCLQTLAKIEELQPDESATRI